MAKKKPAAPKPSGQDIILVYKADKSVSEAFDAWVKGLAAHVGAPVTITFDMALKAFAEERGYKPKMPKRLAR